MARALGQRFGIPLTEHVELSGRGGHGVPFRVVIDRDRQNRELITLSAAFNGKPLGKILLHEKRFPELGIGSAKLGFDESGIVEVALEFGKRRPRCYVGEGGRDVLTVVFESNKKPLAAVTSNEGCKSSDAPVDVDSP
jgi:hypothetical protein